MKIVKRILLIALTVVLSLVLVTSASIYAVWHNELSTVASIELLLDGNDSIGSAPVYMMDVSGGYYFDKFLEQGGASSDGELVEFVMKNITKNIVPINIDVPDFGCSSFTAMGENGDRYFGRNYDFATSAAMIVRTNPPKGRYASISTVDLTFLGLADGFPIDDTLKKFICLAAPYVPVDGINEAGVSCAIYVSYQGKDNKSVATNQCTDKPDITSSTMIRMILDYAGSVEEAVELVKKYDLHDSAGSSYHYMVADSTGKSAILEWVGGKHDTDTDGTKRELKVFYNDDDADIGEKEAANDFQYITNFIVAPGYFEDLDISYMRDRYDAMEQLINPYGNNTKGVIPEENGLKILKRVGFRNFFNSSGGPDNAITVWSAFFNLTDKSVTWVSNEQFDNPKAVFKFDFSYLK